MKRFLLLLLMIAALLIAGLFIFIPGNINIRKMVKIPANREAMYRKLGDAGTWKEWWPGEKKDAVLTLNNTIFIPGSPRTLSVPFQLSRDGLSSAAEITLLAEGVDSTLVELTTDFTLSSNPVKRISDYFTVQEIRSSCSMFLEGLLSAFSQVTKLYDYEIRKEKVVDSNLVFTSGSFNGTPAYSQIYGMVDKLSAYIRLQQAKETGFPMLYVFTRDSLTYEVKVAIPVDRRLPDAGDIRYKWMLGGGNILITEVKGGPQEIQRAYTQINNYVTDHKRIAPAIPFESLVTNRFTERDSSKWITRIYFPVM